MRIQLWSYNYAPEPTGIGPVSRVWAETMLERGHDVTVVAAHPHYPEPRWGQRILPYREMRNDIPVLRLPLWMGRASTLQRYRQEASFVFAQSATLPALSRSDVIVSVSPSFPALLPAMLYTRARRIPWVLWLQDILPDGAAATGLVESGFTLTLARRLEIRAYGSARRIVIPSRSFAENLSAKDVSADKVAVIYNPATRTPKQWPRPTPPNPGALPLRIFTMGNIGRSQGLARLVRAFEEDEALDASFVIAGTGVTASEVRTEIRSERVKLLGLVDDDRLEHELQRATLALVSQHHEGTEFNIPSKMMNFMRYGLPVVASVDPDGEIARIVWESKGGWVVDSQRPSLFTKTLRDLSTRSQEIQDRGIAAYEHARQYFSCDTLANSFDRLLGEVVNPTYAPFS